MNAFAGEDPLELDGAQIGKSPVQTAALHIKLAGSSTCTGEKLDPNSTWQTSRAIVVLSRAVAAITPKARV